MTQEELDIYYLKVAMCAAENSKAKRLQVGAVIVKDRQIISDGFNGTPSGFDNDCEWYVPSDLDCRQGCEGWFGGYHRCRGCPNAMLKTKPEVLHAESNAITKCARLGLATAGSTIYITHAPCVECAKLIIQAGCKRVVYHREYKSTDGVELLSKAGITVVRLSPKMKDGQGIPTETTDLADLIP